MDSSFVPLLYELSSVQGVEPYWPSVSHYCRPPGTRAEATVYLRAPSLEHAELLVHHVAYVTELGALSATWRLSIEPHLAGSDATTLALGPAEGSFTAETAARDLRALAKNLGSRMRQLARAWLSAQKGSSAETRTALPKLDSLSSREREVLELFLSGVSVRSLAKRLFISEHTVRNHLKHLYGKLGVSSQRELREAFSEK